MGTEISEKYFKLKFLNSVTVPKNVKGGTLWNILTSIVLQNIETKEVQTLWWNPKKGPIFSRLWTSMFLFWMRFWRFEYVLDVRS